MRRFVAGWIFYVFVSGLMVGGFAQSGTMGEKGAAGAVSVPLEKTEWRLVRLGRATVRGDDLHRPPQIVLDPVSRRASGSGGCNRIVGGYDLKGDKLTFEHMASTMMACPGGMDTEKKFLKMLWQAKQWKITGRELELMDGSRKVVAVFEMADSGTEHVVG
jgi:heat shock protein HslJ